MKKKIFSLLLIALFTLSPLTPAYAAELSDLKTTDWYYTEVSEMVDAGYITGYPDGSFKGKNSVSLVEFITIVARITGNETGASDGHWGGIQLATAMENGWIDEYDLSLVGYSEPISRQLAAKIMVMALELPDSHTPSFHVPFSDFADINEAYVHYVVEAYHYGIFVGDTDGSFGPFEPLIRGAAATVIYRSVNTVQTVFDKYSQQEIIDYLAEVALQSEYDINGNAGQSNPVVKWMKPIKYYLSGDYTEQDILILSSLMDELNSIDGFPGISAAQQNEANMTIRFTGSPEMDYVNGGKYDPWFEGYATIWWTNWSITESSIFYRSDWVSQFDRNPTICEELIQSLGMLNDSYTHPDSVFYQYYTDIQWPSDLDWLMVELLYDDSLQPGMNEEQCRAALADILQNKY